MARTKISEFSATPGNNTDIDGINIAEGCAPSGINDAIRELMSQLKDFQAGTAGDSFNGPVGTTTAAAGAFTTLSASSTVSGTGFSNYLASPPAIGGTAAAAGSFTTLSASSTVTLSGGTANGVLYLNGSKVATSGSALTFDGASNFSYGGSNASTYNTLNVNNTSATGFARILFNVGSSGANGIAAIKYAPGVFMQIGPDANDTTTPLVFAVNNGSEQMRLTSTGLGIGTSSPGGKLEVYSGASGATAVSNGTNLIIQNSTAVGMSLLAPDANACRIYFGTASNNRNAFIYSDYNSGAQTLIFGVGTSTVAATERMRIDSSGNLGLGVTPSAWSFGGVLQSGRGSWYGDTGGTEWGFNTYYNAGYKYIASSVAASKYQQAAGAHNWYTAASGTAGNAISFTQAMTLDASGNLVVGATSANARLDVVGGTGIRVNEDGASTKVIQVRSNFAGVGPAINVATNDPLLLQTNNTERARIDSSGNLLVGKTATTYTTDGLSLSNAGSNFSYTSGSVIAVNRNGTDGNAVEFYKAGTLVGSISVTGSATAYNTSSDPRLKTLIGSVTGSGERIDALQPVEFEWKADGKRARGFFADKFQEVYPDSVTGEKDAVDAEGKPVYQSMQASTSEVIADLVAEIQSLRKRLAAAGIA